MEPPKRGFAMVPHQLTFDMTISPVSKNLYAALLYLAKGSAAVNGQKAAEVAGQIELKPSTFRKCLKQLEDGNYIARKNKQSRWFEIEFVAEPGAILATTVASKEAGYSPRKERVGRDTRYNGSKYSLHTERLHATDVASKAAPLPISEFDKGDKKRRTTSSTTDGESGEAEKTPDALAKLIAWLPAVSDDRKVLKDLARKVPLWAERVAQRFPQFAAVALDWVKDALVESTDKEDLVRYAGGVLRGYAEKGGREGIEVAAPPRPPRPGFQLKAGPAPNLPAEGETRALLASRRDPEAERAARKARWEALPPEERGAIESQFDADNPKPAGFPPKLWATTRSEGCLNLMDRLNVRHSEAS